MVSLAVVTLNIKSRKVTRALLVGLAGQGADVALISELSSTVKHETRSESISLELSHRTNMAAGSGREAKVISGDRTAIIVLNTDTWCIVPRSTRRGVRWTSCDIVR